MASKKEIEKQTEEMRKQGFTEEEIADMLATDKAIDQGAKLFELADELKAGAKKARQADRKIGIKPNREKKIDNDKLFLIDTIIKALPAENVEVTNPEREFTFTYNGAKYRITLAKPRN